MKIESQKLNFKESAKPRIDAVSNHTPKVSDKKVRVIFSVLGYVSFQRRLKDNDASNSGLGYPKGSRWPEIR